MDDIAVTYSLDTTLIEEHPGARHGIVRMLQHTAIPMRDTIGYRRSGQAAHLRYMKHARQLARGASSQQ